jgi:hypothetical protein
MRRTAWPVTRFALLWFLFGAVTAPLRAQAAAARGVIDGVVTDTSLVPLEGATAEILASSLKVRTGDNGRFRMVGLPDGQYLLVIRRLGYSPFSTLVAVRGADTARTAFMLRPTAVSLDKILVNAASASPVLSEFENRRARGVGQFMTESEIYKLNFVGTSGLLRTFLGTAVTDRAVLNTRGFGLRKCPYRIFVDGTPIAPVVDLDTDLPPPGQLAGIEVHTNSATVPLQYATFGGAAGTSAGGAVCGVILLWTKH